MPPVADTLPAYAAYAWNGLFVQAGTPSAVVARLNDALNNVIRAPADCGATVKAQTDKRGGIIRSANIRAE